MARETGVEVGGELLVRHDLRLTVEDDRFEHLVDDEAGGPAPAILSYGCVRIAGAPAYRSGTDMQVVITGLHENGWRITIAGQGAIGFDDTGSIGIEFELAPGMTVHHEGGGDE